MDSKRWLDAPASSTTMLKNERHKYVKSALEPLPSFCKGYAKARIDYWRKLLDWPSSVAVSTKLLKYFPS